eukprot:40744-Eustigmatos_ZCMA.PRE.1
MVMKGALCVWCNLLPALSARGASDLMRCAVFYFFRPLLSTDPERPPVGESPTLSPHCLITDVSWCRSHVPPKHAVLVLCV